jgi:branched-chain amino acid transport system ATP-binding protein
VPLLDVRGVSKRFGGLAAVREVSLSVEEGEIVGLIGPNGAGKTTLFNLISGVYHPDRGQILYRSRDITRLPLHATAALGLVRTFQLSSLFMDLTVFENVLIAAYRPAGFNLSLALFGTGADRKQAAWAREKAAATLDFMRLTELRDATARVLPYGHQKSLSVAVALACNPAMLLLDEPMAGLNDTETRMMMDDLRRIRATGLSMIVVEHNMTAVMALSDRIAVLNFGEKLAEGGSDEVRRNPQVIAAYLGSDEFSVSS